MYCFIVYIFISKNVYFYKGIQEDEIWDYFKDCGTISAVRIVRDNATGVSKGFGYVDFEVSIFLYMFLELKYELSLSKYCTFSHVSCHICTTQYLSLMTLDLNTVCCVSWGPQKYTFQICISFG